MVTVAVSASLATPRSSKARTRTVWVPLGAALVSQLASYGAVVSSTMPTPGSAKRTRATEPSGSAAVAVTRTVPPTVLPSAGDVRVAVGGSVTGGGSLESREKRSRSGDPVPGSATAPGVAPSTIAAATWAGRAVGLPAR